MESWLQRGIHEHHRLFPTERLHGLQRDDLGRVEVRVQQLLHHLPDRSGTERDDEFDAFTRGQFGKERVPHVVEPVRVVENEHHRLRRGLERWPEVRVFVENEAQSLRWMSLLKSSAPLEQQPTLSKTATPDEQEHARLFTLCEIVELLKQALTSDERVTMMKPPSFAELLLEFRLRGDERTAP
ncbi:MAG: hypothetical protein ACR2F0_06720 [Chthoniobacterales bacterium]